MKAAKGSLLMLKILDRTWLQYTVFGGMHYCEATNSSARLDTEMAADNALRERFEEMVSCQDLIRFPSLYLNACARVPHFRSKSSTRFFSRKLFHHLHYKASGKTQRHNLHQSNL